ncbi:SGNH/GDSL hydrolase family protein [Halalkalibacter akibai]|uniref:Putative secreted protein n=1 Tax=Halalkalibacter akibai (strain ATCC 43226 / DSM 21942 / CIP 109018 / JCM 9157 / 1139) TaxID=1236973 RepID=W4QTU2_HALA3|nr:SGNH/GDSL hydrolase family protein [Halalkalibacter akibai]GAE35023.1 putative secreted protein [Halalkalibacter akibai JCM 9157]
MVRNKVALLLIAFLTVCASFSSFLTTSVEAKEMNNSGHWIGAWSASQVAAWETVDWDGDVSRNGFTEQTLRMIVNPNASGSAVRIRLSNQFGNNPLTFGKVTIADTKAGAEVVSGSVKKLTFHNSESVTIPAGEEVFSDPIPFDVTDGSNLTISVFVPNASGPTTWHPTSNQTTYISTKGDFSSDTNGESFDQTFDAWYWLSGVDVLTKSNKKSRVIVALGDSITDGYLSTLNENRRWTDVLNDLLNNEIKNQTFSVLNQGISGNRILTDSPIFGERALSRLERDVFSQTGVTDIILLEGINDIGHTPHVYDAKQIISGMKNIASQAHDRGLRIYVGTLTPFNAYEEGEYYTEEGETTRQEVNAWIRNNDIFDGVIDFDKTLADPSDPTKMLPAYDSGDQLHPNDAGLKAMADSIDLSIFEKPLKRNSGSGK